MKVAVLLLLIVAGSLAQADAGIYKWVDADGNVYFSDCPPDPQDKCEVEEVIVDPGPALSEEDLQSLADRRLEWLRDLDQRFHTRQKHQEKEGTEKRVARAQEAEFGEQQCILARRNLEQLLVAEPVYRVDSRSRVVREGEDEVLKDIETMREIIEQYCDD